MKFKKALAALLCAAMVLGLAACGGTAQSSGTPAANAGNESKTTNLLSADSAMDYFGFDFGQETVKIPNTVEVAVLKGSWYEMGMQYAEQASLPVRYLIASQINNAIASWGSLEAVYNAMPEYEAMLKEAFPTYLDFVQGVTDGLNKQGYDIAYLDVLVGYTSLGPAPKACMATSAWGEATADGRTYAAMHSDSTHQAVYTQPAILAYPDDGNAFLSALGFTNAYVNDKGLVSMITFGYGMGEGDMTDGLPICIGALYNAAYADNVDTAVQNHIDKLRVGSGEICHYADKSGNGAILETTAAHYAVRRAGDFGENDYLVQSNGWLTDEMQSSAPVFPDNVRRYDSVKKVFDDNLGQIDLDVMREALSNTAYWVAEKEEWVYEWILGGEEDESASSPENKDPKYGCVVRRLMDAENGIMYVLMGSEDTLISKVPGSLGTYSKLQVTEDPSASLNEALDEARNQLWYAARDLTAARTAGEDISAREELIDVAREAIFEAMNYQIAAGVSNGDESLSMIAKGISAAAKAQGYAKAAQSGDVAEIMDK